MKRNKNGQSLWMRPAAWARCSPNTARPKKGLRVGVGRRFDGLFSAIQEGLELFLTTVQDGAFAAFARAPIKHVVDVAMDDGHREERQQER